MGGKSNCYILLTDVVDADPQWSELILVGWIRIRLQEGKINPNKVKKFNVLKCWMFSFEDWMSFKEAKG
jgi:hypothetical protein